MMGGEVQLVRKRWHWLWAVAASMPATGALAQLAAFPGAMGFGAQATGGRAGSVVVVSNNNSSGPGSFAAAVETANSIVVFTTSGYISLGGEISVAKNVTILGQTAPGEGIGLMDGELSFSNGALSNQNDIIQYVRLRQGNGTGVDTNKSAIEMDYDSNVIINHSSIQFGEFDSADVNNSKGVTIQNSIVSDAIGQQFGIHAQATSNFTLADNIFANDHNRNPFIENTGSVQFVNNVVYNVQGGFTSGSSSGSRVEDVVNNYFVTGPSTTSSSDAAFFQVGTADQMYASGNLLDSNKDGTLNGSSVTPSGVKAEASPWSATTQLLPTQTAAAAFAWDVATAGASFARDPLDTLDTAQVASVGKYGGETGLSAPNNPSSDYLYGSPGDTNLGNGGYGTITTGTAAASSANDGVPDTWAKGHGALFWGNANGTTLSDAGFATAKDPLGYDEVEDYANELSNDFPSQTWTASSGNWTTAANWASSVPGVFQQALIRGSGTADGAVSINTSGNTAESVSIGGNGLAAGEQLSVTSGGGLSIEDTITVGDQNNGVLNISGGMVTAGNVQLGNTIYNAAGTSSTTYTGTLDLTGGTLQTSELVQGGGIPGKWTTGAAWNWSGGTLQSGLNGLQVTAQATLGAAGGILDTNGEFANLSGLLSGAGGLTKVGSGTATLSAANTYGGTTSISGGVLALGNGGSLAHSNISITAGTLEGSGTGGAITENIVANNAELISIAGSGVLSLTYLTLNVVVSGTQTQSQFVLANQKVGSAYISGTAFAGLSLPSGFTIAYTGTTQYPSDIVLVDNNVAAPEPALSSVVGLGVLSLLRRRPRLACHP